MTHTQNTTIPAHKVTVDSFVSNDGQAAYRAYCNGCSWQEDSWNHEDTEPLAYELSQAAAQDHMKQELADFMGISRDWRQGLAEFATTGCNTETGQWGVLKGRTASGKEMQRTDEAMVLESVTYYRNSGEASRASLADGYR
jgi:hypothetical protein